MQLTNRTEQQVEQTNVPRFLQTMKALAPRSYEKAFHGMDEQVVVFAMSKAIQGLSKQQLQVGLDAMFEQGYCPDPIMFRKWCLGVSGFGDSANPIHASYRARNAALANIEAWLIDDTTKITNAEKQAYDRCYSMFNNLKFNYSDKQKFHTYAAFKDFYDEVVKELVANGIPQCEWVKPTVIENKVKAIRKNYLDDLTDEAREKAKAQGERIKQLVDGGLKLSDAMKVIMSEVVKK